MALPWPLEYLLAHHSHKHVFGGSRLPSLGTIGSALQSWEHKLRWQLVLGAQSRSPWSFLHSKKPYTTPCEAVLPACVEEFFQEAKRAFLQWSSADSSSCLQDAQTIFKSIWYHSLCFWFSDIWPIPGIEDRQRWWFLPRFENSFSWRNSVHSPIWFSIFCSYDRRRICWCPVGRIPWCSFFCSQFRPIPEDEKRSFIGSVLQPARVHKSANVFACLKYTVKTHKPDGQVSFRALHSSVNTPLQGAMKFISFLLKPQLRALPHLLSSSAEVARKLSALRVGPDAHLLKIDIKDFFMDGSQSEIAAACISMVDPAWQSTFRYLIEYILDTQYVVMPCFPDKVYKVRRGAGMGLLCSGELCDSTFYKTVEEQILGNLDRWGVIGYFRFRDDILVIIDSPYTTRLDFVYSLKAKSTVWQLKVEAVSRSEVCFLDMCIFKGERWHTTKCLDVTIYHKETAQKQILATHSLHPPHTHLSWPRSLIHRIFTLCNTRTYQFEELSRLKRMLADRCGMEHVLLVFDPPLRRAPKLACHDSRRVASRLIIPYHREWEIGSIHSTLQRILSRYSETLHQEFNASVTISIAHTLQQRHLDIQLWNLWLQDHGRRLGTEVD